MADAVHNGSEERITPRTDSAVSQRYHKPQRFDSRGDVVSKSALAEEEVESIKSVIDDLGDLVTALSVSINANRVERY